MRPLRRAALAVLIATFLLAVLAACSKQDDPVRPITRGAAIEDPRLVVRRFRDAWVRRDTTELDSTLTLAFGSAFGCQDSAGSLFFYLGPDRDSLLLGAARLFHDGSASHPPATTIDVAFDSLDIFSDPHDPVHLKNTIFEATVTVRTPADTLRLGGTVGFELIRGDFPLAAAAPDSTRWFIGSWVEISIHSTTSVPAPLDRRMAARRALARALGASGPAKGARSLRMASQSECDSSWATTWSYAARRYLE